MHEHRLVTTSVAATQPSTQPSTRPSSGTTPVIPPDITTHHAYAVLDYDPSDDTLEIWNPHGQLFTPKGEPGLSNGYLTRHGRFRVPLPQAYRFVSGFVFELSAKATAPATASVMQNRIVPER